MKRDFLKLTALILAMTLFFAGCGYRIGQSETAQSEDTEGNAEKEEGPKSVINTIAGEITNPEDDVFTICWQKYRPLNPFGNMTAENEAVTQLVYEGLFTVTPDFRAEPCICDRYVITGTTYTLYLRDDITFHDGVKVTATDAVYSLELARAGERFAARLDCIDTVEYVSELCLRINLKAEDRTLPLLLDIPIVEYGSGEDDSPTGTGPYILRFSQDRLEAYPDYRDKTPIDVIYLFDNEGVTPAAAMSRREVDLILYDTSEGSLDVYTEHETRYYDSSVLQFIGFNTRNYVLSYSEVRRAIGHAVNRESVLEGFASGSAAISPLVLNRVTQGYDFALENKAAYDPGAFTKILEENGAEDRNGDGWLELDGAAMSFDLIVCRESPGTVSAAEELAESLGNVGVKITLHELGYDEYMAALRSGSFDMYYGEVRLPANFDLTPILGSQGSLNYGKYTGYDDALRGWLTAKNDAEKAEASEELCQLVYEEAPIIPLCYRRNAVSIPRGRITGMEPGQQYLFGGLSGWKINLDQEG